MNSSRSAVLYTFAYIIKIISEMICDTFNTELCDVIVCSRKGLELTILQNPFKSYIHNDNQYRKYPGATGYFLLFNT